MIPAKWPCSLSDKLADWQALAITGGEALIRDKVVLNLGPGYGVEEFLLAHLAARWIVQDNDPDVLARAVQAAQSEMNGPYEVESPVASLLHTLPEIPLPDDSVDLVLDFSTLDNTPDPVGAYVETFRVLRPLTGILISTYSNRLVVPPGASSESTFVPAKLSVILNHIGYDVRFNDRNTEARAVVVGQVPAHKAQMLNRWRTNAVLRAEAYEFAQ